MFNLEDVSKETRVRIRRLYTNIDVDVKIGMVIKAPKGTLALFDRGYASPDTQCEAIKAFMEQHRRAL